MRKILLFTFLLFNFQVFSQSLSFWAPVDVCASTYQGNRPRIALINETTPVIAFSRTNPDPAAFVSVWNGVDFGTPVRLTNTDMMVMASIVNGPEIKTQGNTIMIVYAAHTMTDMSNNIYLSRSLDGGMTWSDTINVAKFPDSVNAEYPDITILPNGNPVITFMKATNSYDTTQMMACYSTDGGNTFSTPQNVSNLNPGMACECCPNSLVNNGDTVILAYRINDSNLRDFYGVISYDGGQTFTNGFRIDNSGWINPVCPTNGIDLLAVPGKILAAFPTMVNSYVQLKTGEVNTSSLAVAPNSLLDPAPATWNQSYPAIAGKADTICAVWHDNRNTNLDAIASVSVTGINGFAAPQVINVATNGTQKQSDVAYGKGYFHFVFYDYTGKAIYRLGSLFPNSTGDLRNENRISVFPNPAENDVLVSSSSVIKEIHLVDITGKELLEYTCNSHKEKLPVNALAPGVYFVKVVLEEGSSSLTRFVKN
ncbi:MAG: T9SS type A sorting domain-containing protein [Bacteroidota bacterium]